MKKKYVVELSDADRQHLQEIVSKGHHASYKIKHANILLKADITGPGWPDTKISRRLGAIRRRFGIYVNVFPKRVSQEPWRVARRLTRPVRGG